MQYLKLKHGEIVAVPDEARVSEAEQSTEAAYDKYVASQSELNQEDFIVDVPVPPELEFIVSHGGTAKALYAVAEKLGMVGGDGGLTPADDLLVSDNFSDGNGKAPFNLQVRNTTGDTVEFVAVVSDVPYSEIPDLVEGEYSHKVSKVTEGYVHTFSGKFRAYQSITITGGVPSPAGTGDGLALFVK